MAFIPDEAIRRMREIPLPAYQLYTYYCMKRSNATGDYEVPNKLVTEETGMDRSQVHRMRHVLIAEGWIEADGDRIRPILGDFSPADRRTRAGDGASPPHLKPVTERHKEANSGDAPSQNAPNPVTLRHGVCDGASPKMPDPVTERHQTCDGASPHIRNTSPLTSPERPALSLPTLSRPPQPTRSANGARESRGVIGAKSRHSEETCVRFARSLPGIRAPDGFGRTIWRDGSRDDEIDNWLANGAKVETREEKIARLLRERTERKQKQA